MSSSPFLILTIYKKPKTRLVKVCKDLMSKKKYARQYHTRRVIRTNLFNWVDRLIPFVPKYVDYKYLASV